MICTVCGSSNLSLTEYRMSASTSCPARSCDSCGAINLAEEPAQSDDERESVREAISTRGSASSNPGPAAANATETVRPPPDATVNVDGGDEDPYVDVESSAYVARARRP
jgi:hypothetical protein